MFKKKVLRKMFGPVEENGTWIIRCNELYQFHEESKLTTVIKFSRLDSAGMCNVRQSKKSQEDYSMQD